MAMSSVERLELLDAAMRSGDAETYLTGVQSDLEAEGRRDDALAAAVLRSLLSADEIETVMHIRAEWQGRRASSRPSASA